MDENNNNPNTPNPQNDFDLDAALEEKFQQVQQDLDRLRAMNANADAQQAAESADVPPEESTEETTTPEEPLPETEPAEDAPQFEIAEEALSETAPAANTPEDKESARERKARYKLKRQILITNRVGAVVRIFAIGSIIFGGSIFLLVGNRPTESAEENRKLATPPSFSMDALESGDYIADWMHYYEDTVPGRSNFKHMISKLESYQGLQGEDKVQFYGNIAPVKKDTESEKKDNVTTTAPVASGNSAGVTTTVTTVTTEPEADPVEIGDGIVLVDKRAISIYGGSFSRGEKYAATLNEYKKQLGDKVNVYSLVAPTAVSFYLPDSYSGYTGSEPDNIDHIDENLQNVKAVDAICGTGGAYRRGHLCTYRPPLAAPGRLLCGRGVCQDSRRKLCAAVQLHQDHTFRLSGQYVHLYQERRIAGEPGRFHLLYAAQPVHHPVLRHQLHQRTGRQAADLPGQCRTGQLVSGIYGRRRKDHTRQDRCHQQADACHREGQLRQCACAVSDAVLLGHLCH